MKAKLPNAPSPAKPVFAGLPRDWLVTCIVRPWATANYDVSIKKRDTVWKMGVSIGGKASPVLDWQSWRTFFAILTFLKEKNSARIGYRELCKRMNVAVSGQMMESIRLELRRLHDYWIKRERKFDILEFSLLEKVSYEKKPLQNEDQINWFFEVSIFEDFRLLITGSESQQLRFDQLCGIRSSTVGGLYLFLPSRAYHYKNPESPLTISLKTMSKFLDKEGASTSIIYKLLNQHSQKTGGYGSVVDQLDGRLMKGGIFRCILKQNGLTCWCEVKQTAPSGGLLRNVFLAGGGKEEHYIDAFASAYPEMRDAQWEKISRLGVDSSYRRFCSMACRLLSSFSPLSFDGIIAVAEERFCKIAIRNPGKVFSTMLLDAVETAPGLKSLQGKWWDGAVSARLNNARKSASAKQNQIID